LYILNFLCKETNEQLDEPREFSREEGQLFLNNVVGQSLAQYDREKCTFYNYTHFKTEIISPKSIMQLSDITCILTKHHYNKDNTIYYYGKI
jgi:hypothetical protein